MTADLEARLAEPIAQLATATQPDLGHLVLASTFAAHGRLRVVELQTAVALHARAGHDPVRMREALLQTYLFGGYPLALNALRAMHRVLQAEAPDALAALPAEPLESPTSAMRTTMWLARGTRLAQAVYGDAFDKLMAAAREASPDLAQWLVMEGYGRVLGRPGLPFPVRECCIVAALVPLGVPMQLYSHLRGCLRVGVPADTVSAVLDAVLPYVNQDLADEALQTWASVTEAANNQDASPGREA